jgi:hypothetical protein
LSFSAKWIEASANLKLTVKPWVVRGAASPYESYGFWGTAVPHADMTGRRVGIRVSAMDFADVARF